MTDYVAVLPFIWRPYFDAFMATCKIPRDKLLLVDNTINNVGIMRAHNMGVDLMRARGADWLIIMSAAIRFGEKGGLDFADLLSQNPEAYIVHGATPNVVADGNANNRVFGWHLSAFHRRMFDAVGTWDENFTPYGPDDIDLSVRIQKHFRGAPGWLTLPCDVSDTTMGHSINLAGLRVDYEPQRLYFHRKWGREPGDGRPIEDYYDHPFNDKAKPLSYWPDPDSEEGIRWRRR